MKKGSGNGYLIVLETLSEARLMNPWFCCQTSYECSRNTDSPFPVCCNSHRSTRFQWLDRMFVVSQATPIPHSVHDGPCLVPSPVSTVITTPMDKFLKNFTAGPSLQKRRKWLSTFATAFLTTSTQPSGSRLRTELHS